MTAYKQYKNLTPGEMFIYGVLRCRKLYNDTYSYTAYELLEYHPEPPQSDISADELVISLGCENPEDWQ